MFDRYNELSDLADEVLFTFLYKEAVSLTASSYGFSAIVNEQSLEFAYHRFIKRFVPLSQHDYSDEKIVTLAVAICMQATSAFPLILKRSKTPKVDNVQSQYDGIAIRYVNELAALSFGVMIFSVESSRILRASGYYSSNYIDLEFLDIATVRKAVKTIAAARTMPNGARHTRNFHNLIRIFQKALAYKVSSGFIIQS